MLAPINCLICDKAEATFAKRHDANDLDAERLIIGIECVEDARLAPPLRVNGDSVGAHSNFGCASVISGMGKNKVHNASLQRFDLLQRADRFRSDDAELDVTIRVLFDLCHESFDIYAVCRLV